MRPAPEPHDLGGRTQRCSEFVEVRVCGYNNKIGFAGKIPDLAIRALQQIELSHMSRTWI